MEFEIKHDEKNQQFYIAINSDISFLKYRKVDDTTLDYYMTFTPVHLRGQGIAVKMTQHALEYAKQNNYKIIPSCPFVATFIKSHSEYREIVKK